MKTKTLMTALILGSSLVWSSQLEAHGGTYRGPGDFVPPHNGSGSTKTGGPNGPSTPSGPTPRTPRGPKPNTGGPTPTGGYTPGGTPNRTGTPVSGGTSVFATDMSSWTFWWEFNKDPYLKLRERMQGKRAITMSGESLGRGPKREVSSGISPTRADQDRVLVTLMNLLENKPDNRDIVSSALVAVAKIGGDKDYLPLLRSFLNSNSQEIRETAALSLGISARVEAAPILFALAKNTNEGQKLVGSRSVSFRTRAFACYGLGLIAHDSRSQALGRKVFKEMQDLIDAGRSVRSDIQVAALHALRLLNPDHSQDGQALRNEVADYLLAFVIRTDKAHRTRVRSHGLNALARIVGRRDLAGKHKDLLYKAFSKRKKIHSFVDQSLLQALGAMCNSNDTEIATWIRKRQEKSRDQDARHFGMIALGRVGGEENRSYLLKKLAKTNKRMDRAWYALAIALLHYEDKTSNELTRRSDGDTLHMLFKKEKNRSVAAGIAIALGIMDYKAASLDILDRLESIQKHDEPAGYLALSLGMMGEHEARETLQHLIGTSKRRDQLLMQVSIGLGLLGDHEITNKLVALLEGKHTTVAVYGSVATALGFLNDRRSLDPLLALLNKEDLPGLSRAFAAVSLGLVAEKESLPWNSKIATGSNYVANFETLTGGSLGVLDIL